MEQRLKIIYEDEELLVCDKPYGLPVQSRKTGVMDLEGMVRRELVKKTGNTAPFVSCVHRLDQPVEGIVLFAKNKKSMEHLSKQIREHTAGKYYLAVTEGVFGLQQETLVNYLKKDGRLNHSVVVDQTDKDGKLARLEYKVLETSGQHQLLEIHLLTGRHHQIRVQLSHAGHPIVEDVRYNPSCRGMHGRPALCAYRLLITHPSTREKMQFTKRPEGKHFQEFSSRIENL